MEREKYAYAQGSGVGLQKDNERKKETNGNEAKRGKISNQSGKPF